MSPFFFGDTVLILGIGIICTRNEKLLTAYLKEGWWPWGGRLPGKVGNQ